MLTRYAAWVVYEDLGHEEEDYAIAHSFEQAEKLILARATAPGARIESVYLADDDFDNEEDAAR